MHLPTLQKLLALFISGSILITSVPAYAGETTSLTEPVTSEIFAEADDLADNSDDYNSGTLADEEMAGENLTDTVDENRDITAGPEIESATGDDNNTSDSETDVTEEKTEEDSADSNSETGNSKEKSETDDSEANEEEGGDSSLAGADAFGESDSNSDISDVAGESDTNSDISDVVGESDTYSGGSDTSGEKCIKAGGFGTSGESDTNPGDSDTSGDSDITPGGSGTSGEKTDDSITVTKKESFTHLFYKDVNDPAYDELRKELDAIFQNAQLQDTTDLPANYSLVSLPFGGEGSGGSADRSAPIKAAQGRDLLMPVYNQGLTMGTCWSFTGTGIIESDLIRNQYAKLGEQGIELSKWQVAFAISKTAGKDTVIGGYHVDPSQYGEGLSQGLNQGGTPSSYGQLVTSWAGLDYEKNVPTPRDKNKLTKLTPAQIDQAVVRGRDALFLPTPTPNMAGHEGYDKKIDPKEAVVYDPAAVAAIKNCLMTLGPVYAEICYQEDEPAKKGGINMYENWEYGSMYYPLWTDDTTAAHAVTIVGWDDHYSRSLFGENTPPGDGAFLIKNSFGKMGEKSKAGDQSLFREGYFWLSYYDATIQTPATFTGTLVEDGKYDHLYMNDYIGFVNTDYVEIKAGAFDSDRNNDGVIQKDELVKCANVFKAKDNEMLKSVGVLANRANSLVEYWIYLLKEGYSNPEDGELVYSAVGENGIKAKYAGYNVQDLDTPIALLKDQLFSVVARVFGSEGGQLPLEAASTMADSSRIKIARGQTYYTDKSGNWVDACDFRKSSELFNFRISDDKVEAVGNATVRAMTSDANLSYKVTKGDGSEWKSDTSSELKISANGKHERFSYLMIDGKLIDASEYTLSGSETDAALSADLLKRLGEGEHTIMFVYDDGWASGTFFVTGDHYGSEDECNDDNCELSTLKSGSPQTGDTTADGIPVCAVFMMFSLAGIAVVRRVSQGRTR